jgi:hypothetical protein
MRMSFALIVFISSLLAGCNSSWPWPKGETGSALRCSGIVTDTRLKPSDEGYERQDVDMYGWTCIPPEYHQQLQDSNVKLTAELKKCKINASKTSN